MYRSGLPNLVVATYLNGSYTGQTWEKKSLFFNVYIGFQLLCFAEKENREKEKRKKERRGRGKKERKEYKKKEKEGF